jgi:enoyl-CoA hydratase/carnithine racemase
MFSESPDRIVESSLADGVLQVVLNDPQRLNALSWPMLDALEPVLAGIREPEVRVVLLAGNGRAFCSGGDMRAMSVDDPGQATAYVSRITEVIATLRRCPKPVVAAVQGYAVGGGAELALEADILVLADTAIFRQPDVAIGSTPATAYRLVQLVGYPTAARVVLGGQDLDAPGALALGLTDRLVSPDQLHDEARAVAQRMAELSPKSLQFAKQALRLANVTDGETDLAVNLQSELALYFSPEQRAAVAGFLES